VPWTFKDNNDACFIAKTAKGIAVAYAYCERAGCTAVKLMTKYEARRIAANLLNCLGCDGPQFERRVVSQQTIVAVALTLAVVAIILVVVLLWPLGRLPWP
jgi:hypothetical protein